MIWRLNGAGFCKLANRTEWSGAVFSQVGGVVTYQLKVSSRTGEATDELIISTREAGKTVTRSSVELALERFLEVQKECGYVKGPKAAGQIFGGSYLYSVFLAWGVIKCSPST